MFQKPENEPQGMGQLDAACGANIRCQRPSFHTNMQGTADMSLSEFEKPAEGKALLQTHGRGGHFWPVLDAETLGGRNMGPEGLY